MKQKNIYISNEQSRKFNNIDKSLYVAMLNKYSCNRFESKNGIVLDAIENKAINYKNNLFREVHSIALWDINEVIVDIVDSALGTESFDYKGEMSSCSTHLSWKDMCETLREGVSFGKPKRGRIFSEDIINYIKHVLTTLDSQSLARLSIDKINNAGYNINIIKGNGWDDEVNLFYEVGFDCYKFLSDSTGNDCLGWFKKIYDSSKTESRIIEEILNG